MHDHVETQETAARCVLASLLLQDHDLANLLLLTVMLCLDGAYALALRSGDEAAAERWWPRFFSFSVFYFAADTAYILLVPESCATPKVTILVTLAQGSTTLSDRFGTGHRLGIKTCEPTFTALSSPDESPRCGSAL